MIGGSLPGLFFKNGACHYGLLKVHQVHMDIYDQNYLL
jgi:hypothetical protein